MKFYMLSQMSFWLHCYPELYFMKAKKVNPLYDKNTFGFAQGYSNYANI